MLLLLMAIAMTSFAQNIKVSMEDFNIAPGEQREVAILLNNDVACYGMAGDIYLPEGLEIVCNEDGDYLTRNMARCLPSHGLTASTKKENTSLDVNQLRFSLLNLSRKTLIGNEGAVLTFTVKATIDLKAGAVIEFKDATIYHENMNGTTMSSVSCLANVHNTNLPTLTLSAPNFSLTPSKEVKLSFAFDTNVKVSAFQADITLPEGLTPVQNEDEEYATFNWNRLTSSHIPTTTLSGNKIRIVVYSTSSNDLKGTEGELFYITLKATEDLVEEESFITVNEIIASTSAGDKKDVKGFIVKVSNPDVAAKAGLDASMAALKKCLQQLQDAWETYAESVKAEFAGQKQTAEKDCENIEKAIAEDVTNGDVAANAATRQQAIDELQSQVETLKQEADAAQKAYEENAANQAAYERLTKELATVQAEFDAAKTEVETTYAAVAEQFAETIGNIQVAIDALKADVDTKHEKVELTAESTVDTSAITAGIAQLLADAEAAQKLYEANETQYAADCVAIAEVQTQFEGVKTTIGGYSQDVQAYVADDIREIEELLGQAAETAEASHHAGTSVVDADALAGLLNQISDKIEALSRKAQDAQENRVVAGDVDGDNLVDVNDFGIVKLHTLGIAVIEDEERLRAADANGDGKVNVGDLSYIVALMFNPSLASAPAAALAVATNDGLAIRVEGEGMRQRIGILLNAAQAYAACQMDITLPEGITLAQETAGEMAGELTLDSNDLVNGCHRILLSSIEGARMNAGNGTLLWLDVNVEPGYNGEQIIVSDVIFANAMGQTFELAVSGGETTGLNNVSTTQTMTEKIYNAGGILMDGLKRGVNIIRGNDGSSRKVIVK